MRHERDNSKAIFDAVDLLQRYRWRFVIPAFAVVATVLVAGMFLPRKHKAEAHFERRTDIVLAEMTDRGASDAFTDARGTMQNEIVGRPAIGQAIESLEPQLRELGVLKPDQTASRFADQVSYDVLVHWDVRTSELDRVRIEYTGPHPDAAKLIVNALVSGYIDRTRQAMEDRLRESSDFFKTEVAHHSDELEKLEANLLKFELEHGELLPDMPGGVPTKLEEGQLRLADLDAQADTLSRRIEALRDEISKEPTHVDVEIDGKNPDLVRLEDTLDELNDSLTNMTTTLKMTEAHPDVIAVRAEIAKIQQRMIDVPKYVQVSTERQLNHKRSELELRLTQLVADAKANEDQATMHRKRVAALEASAGQLYPVRNAYRQLQREVQQAQRKIDFWQDNLRRIDLALTAESGNRGVQLNFLQPATANRVPVSPNVYQVFAAALLLGIGAGVLGVFIAHRGDSSIQSRDQLASATSLPVIGSVSELLSEHQRRLRTLRQTILYPTAGLAMVLVIGALAVTLYRDVHVSEEPQAAAVTEQAPSTDVTDSSVAVANPRTPEAR